MKSTGTSDIEQDIDDIFEFVESCRGTLGSMKVRVPKDDLYDLLDELRRDVPVEVERYRKMLAQKNAIMEDARKKANEILTDAREQYNAMIEEHTIMQQAYQQAEITINEANEQAEQIIQNARAQANEITDGAIYYTRGLLEDAEKTLGAAMEATTNNAKALEVAMQGHLDIIRQNKSELFTTTEVEAASAKEQETEEASDEQE